MHQRPIILLVLLVCAMTVTTFAQSSYKSGHCPLTSTVSKCTPTCTSDYQCGENKKCCLNKCGSKSCVQPNAVSSGSDSGYKGSSSRDGGVYCSGVRCGPYEKCEFDRVTKRERCVRT